MPNFKDYQLGISPPWLQNQKGSAWPRGQGDVKDSMDPLVREGVKSRFPLHAPAGALAALGNERGIQRGPSETDASYAERIRRAWDTWPWAGTPFGLLSALYASGFKPLLVIPNGFAYRLNDPGLLDNLEQVPLTAGSWLIDPPPVPKWNKFQLLFSTNGPGQPHYAAGWNVSASGSTVLTRTSGSGPSFMILTQPPQAPVLVKVKVAISGNLANGSGAKFSLSTDGGLTYLPNTYFGSGTTTLSIQPAGFFGGSFFFSGLTTNGWVAGSEYTGVLREPQLTAPAAELELIRSLVRKWKPGATTCAGILAVQFNGGTGSYQSHPWGWPIRTWGGGDVFGYSTVALVPGE